MGEYQCPSCYTEFDFGCDVVECAKCGGAMFSDPNKLVRRDSIKHGKDNFLVSTVHLILNHNMGGSVDKWYETMIFNEAKHGMLDLYCDRYKTKSDAIIGHKKAIKEIRKGNIKIGN